MRAFCGVRHAPSVGGEGSCAIPTKREGKHELSARLPQHCTGGALGNHADPAIKTREDFEKYPFDKVPALYAERFGPQFDALRAHMPEGMKAIGGVDTDHLVRMEDEELVKIVRDVYEHCKTGHGGIAIGSGNSIPDYVDVNKYVLMTRTVRECRGDKL